MEPPWEGGTKVYKWSRSHDQDSGHAHIWLKPLKNFFSITSSPMILKLGMKHSVLKLYKVYINDGLDLFYAKVKVRHMRLNGKNVT